MVAETKKPEPQIRIDEDVKAAIEALQRPRESYNAVMRRVLGLPERREQPQERRQAS